MTGREENRRAVIYARYRSENQREASIEDQAGEILRRLSDKIVLTPEDGGLKAELYGDLAEILALCAPGEQNKKLPGTGVPGSQLSVVAGARSLLFRTPVSAFVPIPG